MFLGLLSAGTTGSFGESLASNANGSIKYVSLNNQQCQARPALFNENSNQPLYYSLNVSDLWKFGWSCNTIDDPYVQVCVPNKVKNMNAKGHNLLSGVNETRFLV